MRQQRGSVERTRILRRECKHGDYDPVELSPQQLIFRRIVGVEGGTSNARFFRKVADSDVAVSAPVKQFDKRGIDPLARLNYTPVSTDLVARPTFIVIRDSFRFVFDKCHSFTFSIVRQWEPL